MKRSFLAGAAVTVVIAMGLVTVGAASADADSAYPTWGDVQAAKASEAATQAEVDTINGLLATDQTAANAAAVVAIQRSAAYAEAETKLQTATAKADSLEDQATAASETAAALRVRSGHLTEQLARAGGSNLTASILLSGKDAGRLLYQLGAVSKLTDQATALFKSAAEQSNLAKSEGAAAEAAKVIRDSLAKTAADNLAKAKAAQADANAELAKEQATGQVLYAQLASLQNTTAALVQKYDQGVAAAAAAAQQNGGPANGFAPPIGVSPDPAAAQAYAASAIGAYGWGSDQMSCLIRLWNQESGWRLDAYNTSSGAYGIPQALPATKMASAGPDWQTNAATQINWGLDYISRAYGSPCGAWAHEVSHNWY